MKDRVLFFVFVSAMFVLFGCGGDDIVPGEEVVSDKWKDPKDIGKTYSVGEVKVGDTVILNTGESHVVKENNIIKKT